MLTHAFRLHLADIARSMVCAAVRHQPMPAFHDPTGRDASHHGVFVTLHDSGVLRGCIGCMDISLPLHEALERAAVGAALRDPRFQPVRPSELAWLTGEISVLGPREQCMREDDFIIGTHGLLLEHRSGRGLLLPQVAIEHGWSAADFFTALCRKAGLRGSAQLTTGIRLWRFSADIIPFQLRPPTPDHQT